MPAWPASCKPIVRAPEAPLRTVATDWYALAACICDNHNHILCMRERFTKCCVLSLKLFIFPFWNDLRLVWDINPRSSCCDYRASCFMLLLLYWMCTCRGLPLAEMETSLAMQFAREEYANLHLVSHHPALRHVEPDFRVCACR